MGSFDNLKYYCSNFQTSSSSRRNMRQVKFVGFTHNDRMLLNSGFTIVLSSLFIVFYCSIFSFVYTSLQDQISDFCSTLIFVCTLLLNFLQSITYLLSLLVTIPKVFNIAVATVRNFILFTYHCNFFQCSSVLFRKLLFVAG